MSEVRLISYNPDNSDNISILQIMWENSKVQLKMVAEKLGILKPKLPGVCLFVRFENLPLAGVGEPFHLPGVQPGHAVWGSGGSGSLPGHWGHSLQYIRGGQASGYIT